MYAEVCYGFLYTFLITSGSFSSLKCPSESVKISFFGFLLLGRTEELDNPVLLVLLRFSFCSEDNVMSYLFPRDAQVLDLQR